MKRILLLLLLVLMLVTLTAFTQEIVTFKKYVTNMNSQQNKGYWISTKVIYEYSGENIIYVKCNFSDSVIVNQYKMLTEWKRYNYHGNVIYRSRVYNMNTGEQYNAYTDRDSHFILFKMIGEIQTYKAFRYLN